MPFRYSSGFLKNITDTGWDLSLIHIFAHTIETVRGRYGGGVRVADGYYLGRKYLKPNQQELLKRLSENLTGEDLATMNSILSEFALTKRGEK